MNGLTLLALIALAVGIVVAYRAGAFVARRELRSGSGVASRPVTAPVQTAASTPPQEFAVVAEDPVVASDAADALAEAAATFERARLIRDYAAEGDALRSAVASRDAEIGWLRSLAAERAQLFDAVANARADAARYRQLVIDTENNAPPPLLGSPTAPDDLKLIVGIGPVLERMLQQLGVSTYRQIARWSERDIDEFDARLPEFPGRIRRDAWVTQARALHQSKYGDSAVTRERS